jgi:hypothetical protein
MKLINEIGLRQPLSNNEKMWFGCVSEIIKRTDYGTVELRFTVKKGEVMTIKEKSEKSYSINND